MTQPTTDRHVHPDPILGPTIGQWEQNVYGYSLNAAPVTGHRIVHVWAKDQYTGGHVNLFVTPADARAFAAQLVAAADAIDPDGASQ